jgi:uncharacterized protein YyaL (SSP411 family)
MNRLASSASPYLRQHADNPVEWWEWSGAAFAEAERRNVPVHLSIGYAACHWCHVMARESFSDAATAAQLNRDFVSIKVDREERPEVDQIYMNALHALGEQGGWPLTMFLTPQAEPFWGGTYFPPEPRFGRPSFRQVLSAISDAWTSGDAAVAKNAGALRQHLSRRDAAIGSPPDRAALDRALATLLSVWDHAGGSFNGAPKFPSPVILDVLWRGALRAGENRARAAVLTTLSFLCQGGIYDHLGGGFHRYSVDAQWQVPHFEKMLYDNGLLLSALSLACRADGNPLFRSRIDETIAWLLREMRLPGGAFAASLDADTDHEEGLTYTWEHSALMAELGDAGERFAAIYDAAPAGNFEGRIILNRLRPASFGWLGEEQERDLAATRARLLSARNRRAQPPRDDKVLADWNGLAISGLAQAAAATGNRAAREAAVAAFRFVAESMTRGDRLGHSFLEGTLIFPGVATDYADMIRAAIDLFGLTGEGAYLDQAERWFATADAHHYDAEARAYRLTADDAPQLIAVPLSETDEATPAATGVMAENAARLFMLSANDAFRQRADELCERLAGRVAANVVGSASLQAGYDSLLRGRLAVVAGPDQHRAPLFAAARAEPDPALLILAADPASLPADHPAAGKRPTKGSAALFLCDAMRCLPEENDPGAAAELLAATRSRLD